MYVSIYVDEEKIVDMMESLDVAIEDAISRNNYRIIADLKKIREILYKSMKQLLIRS